MGLTVLGSATCVFGAGAALYSGCKLLCSSKKEEASSTSQRVGKTVYACMLGLGALLVSGSLLSQQGVDCSGSSPLSKHLCFQEAEECGLGTPQEKTHFTCQAGSHTSASPLFGEREHDLDLLQAAPKPTKELLGKFEKPLHDGWNAVFIPVRNGAEAEKIDALAWKKFSQFLDPYREEGLNEYNAVEWHTYEYGTFGYVLPKASQGGVNSCQVRVFDHSPQSFGGRAHPAGVIAIHELMHVQEWCSKTDFSKHTKDKELMEVGPSLNSVILNDEIYKELHQIPLETEVDYGRSITSFSDWESFRIPIPLGRIANFYRNLEQEHGSLAGALISPESTAFLQQSNAFEWAMGSGATAVGLATLLYFRCRKCSSL